MHGIIGAAVLVAGIGVTLIRRLHREALDGTPIRLPPREMGHRCRYAAGGTVFGIGWSLTGACPGPLFALVGAGATVIRAAITAALAGTWVHGVLRPRLQH